MKTYSKNRILNGENAFTVLEIMIAFAIFSLAIAVSVSAFSFFSTNTPVLEGEVFAQQATRNASYIIERRLAMAAEIASPIPVKSASELIFKEADGRYIKLKLNAEDPASPLQSYNYNEKTKSDTLEPTDKPLFVYVKNVEKINFTTLSPAAAMIRIKFRKKNEKSKDIGESAFFVRLKNANATL